ncbi:MAG: hypothetical protein E7633_07540 [Ruminococcaceae bacterium]|nr:hypothetical protein [Oscillospiraceae bacterium]
MAKTKNCSFCGKEITTGFFKGTEQLLNIGKGYYISCCEDCLRKYEKDANRVEDRLGIKLKNCYDFSKKTFNDEDGTKIFLRYLEDEKKYAPKEGYTPESGYFIYDDKGNFNASECELGLFANAKQLEKDMLHILDYPNAWFSKDDVTKLEYRYAGCYTLVGEAFSDAYAFEVRLNDEKEVTYKPAIFRMFFTTKGFTGGSRKKKAKIKCAEKLEEFKNIIGCDLPVVEVKKFN